jgi:hypothetical protein
MQLMKLVMKRENCMIHVMTLKVYNMHRSPYIVFYASSFILARQFFNSFLEEALLLQSTRTSHFFSFD